MAFCSLRSEHVTVPNRSVKMSGMLYALARIRAAEQRNLWEQAVGLVDPSTGCRKYIHLLPVIECNQPESASEFPACHFMWALLHLVRFQFFHFWTDDVHFSHFIYSYPR